MNFTELKNLMDRLTAWRIPGNAISVWKDGEEVFSYQSGFADLENVVPAAAFHVLLVPEKADQLQTAEAEGGKGVLNAGFKKRFSVADAAQVKGIANHDSIIFHINSSL